MLKSLGRPEIDGILAEQGRVEIGCDFCGLKYHFDPVDVGGAGHQPAGLVGEPVVGVADHLPVAEAVEAQHDG